MKLPRAEEEYYAHIKRWSGQDFKDTKLAQLEELVKESRALRDSKVKFPTTDETLVKGLRESMGEFPRNHNPYELSEYKPPAWTFGHVARKLKDNFLIDIEDGNYGDKESRSE